MEHMKLIRKANLFSRTAYKAPAPKPDIATVPHCQLHHRRHTFLRRNSNTAQRTPCPHFEPAIGHTTIVDNAVNATSSPRINVDTIASGAALAELERNARSPHHASFVVRLATTAQHSSVLSHDDISREWHAGSNAVAADSSNEASLTKQFFSQRKKELLTFTQTSAKQAP